MRLPLIKQIESLMTGQDKNGFCLLRYFLVLVSFFYGGVTKLRVFAFSRQILKSQKLPCRLFPSAT